MTRVSVWFAGVAGILLVSGALLGCETHRGTRDTTDASGEALMDAGAGARDAGSTSDAGSRGNEDGDTPIDAGSLLDAGSAADAGIEGVDAGGEGVDAGVVRDDAGGSPLPDAGTDAGMVGMDAGRPGTDAGQSAPDAGSTPSDAGTSGPADAGPPCSTHEFGYCTGGRVCLRECCQPISSCTWVATGSSCPEGMHAVPRDSFTCPGIPGVPADILCLTGVCSPTTYSYRCVDPPTGSDCTGTSCSYCGAMCTGGPAPATRAPGVICRWTF